MYKFPEANPWDFWMSAAVTFSYLGRELRREIPVGRETELVTRPLRGG